MKAQVVTAETYAHELHLSKGIQEDAREMVRRAEYALRKSTTKAQEEGDLRSRQSNLIPGGPSAGKPASRSSSDLGTSRDFFSGKQEYEDANAMGALEPDDFEDVLAEARAEDNLSRANVARKAREKSGAPTKAAPRRALPDQFFDAAYDTAKRVESLHRLIGDDRFPQNAEKVAAKHRNDLLRSRDLLEQVINALPTEESTQ